MNGDKLADSVIRLIDDYSAANAKIHLLESEVERIGKACDLASLKGDKSTNAFIERLKSAVAKNDLIDRNDKIIVPAADKKGYRDD